MLEQDFDRRLAFLANQAGRTGRLDPAADIRVRADRRRRRRFVGTAAFGVVAAVALGTGIALAQPGPGPQPGPPVGTPTPGPTAPGPTAPGPVQPSPSTSPTPTSASTSTPALAAPRLNKALTGADGPFTPGRHYWLIPVVRGQEVPNTVMSLTSSGRVDVTADRSADALFTTAAIAPHSDEWLIRLDRQGGSECISVQADGTLKLPKCGPQDRGQGVSFYEAGRDGQGRMTYAIRTAWDGNRLAPETYLEWDPPRTQGLVAKEEPRTKLATTWLFVDRGRSTLPG
jgi:hypothetical protein